MDSRKNQAPDSIELPDDLDQNPGIGQSKGLFARTGADDRDAELIEGENTVIGDTENDAGLGQGIDPERTGRTND
jgi:hypothetical protein